MDRICRLSTSVLSVVLLAGCSADAPRAGGQDVDNDAAASFLEALESAWQSDLSTAENVRVGDGATCYMLTDATRESFLVESDPTRGDLAKAACGPVRRLGTEERQVWDVYVTAVSQESEDVVGFGNPEAQSTDQALASVAFWRPDGAVPDGDASQLAEPEAPRAEGGLVSVSSDQPTGTSDLQELPDSAVLVTPSITLTVNAIGRTGLVDGDGQIRQAAAGERFVVARIRTSQGGSYPEADGSGGDAADTTTQVYLGVGDQRVPLDLDEPGNIWFDGAQDRELYVLASVPEDAPIALGARSLGLDQVLDLESGVRTTDEAPAFYRSKPVVDIAQSVPASSQSAGDYTGSIGATFDSAYLTAWDADRGWAPAGRAWLELPYDGNFIPDGAYGYDQVVAPSSFVATADGEPAEFQADGFGKGRRLIWLVAADVSAVAVRITPVVSVNASNPSSSDPQSATVTFSGSEFSFNFP